MSIRLTEEERQGQPLESGKLQLAEALLQTYGYVVVENVFDSARLNTLREFVDQTGEAAGGSGAGRFPLPAAAPFTDDDIATNDTILTLVDNLVGSDCVLRVIEGGSVTAANAGELQAETKPLFPETQHVRVPAHKVRVTIALTDVNEASGAMLVWPGSHQQPEHLAGAYGPELLAKLAAAAPSVRVDIPAGAVLIRDSKLWHQEVQPSGERAVTVELTYQRWWDITSPRLVISETVHAGASDRLKRLFRFENLPRRQKTEMSY